MMIPDNKAGLDALATLAGRLAQGEATEAERIGIRRLATLERFTRVRGHGTDAEREVLERIQRAIYQHQPERRPKMEPRRMAMDDPAYRLPAD